MALLISVSFSLQGCCCLPGYLIGDDMRTCTHEWTEATCTSPKTCSICAATEGDALGHTFTNGECNYCGLYDEEYCWPIYQDILNEMMSLDEKMNSIYFIEDNLQKLPLNYRQVDQIREELVFVKTQFEVFSNAIYCDLMKYLCEEEEMQEYYIDYSQVRDAYLRLLNNDEKYDKWNLTQGAENYMVVDGTYLFFVLVGNWQSTSGDYYIDIIENDDNSISLRTNIPNQKDANYDYFYFTDGRNIGYERTDNSDLKFNAFKITEITENYIKVLCYQNSNIYTLYRK